MPLLQLSKTKDAASRYAWHYLDRQFLLSLVQARRYHTYSTRRTPACASVRHKRGAKASTATEHPVQYRIDFGRAYSRIISRTHLPEAPASEARKDKAPSTIDPTNLASRYFGQRDAKFLFSATKPTQYETIDSPEITFAGRSNVGKSSLIGAVLRSAPLVKTSKKPGHTSTLNFFHLSSRAHPAAVSVVDMPGYGYRSRDGWGAFIVQYLTSRNSLRQVFLLVEAKVGELKATDCSFLEIAERNSVPVQIVLTKTDKLKRAELTKASDRIIESAKQIAPSVIQPSVMCCSAKTKLGIHTLQEEILRVCDISSNSG